MNVVANISQSALVHNLSIAQKSAPNSKIVCMVKANAYGHHLDLIQPLLQADILAVSELNEAKKLRKLSDKPILLLSGVFNQADFEEAINLNCQLVLNDISQLDTINQSKIHANIWIKIDTGMHRLGITPKQLNICLEQLEKNSMINIECIMSHFACADNPNNAKNTQQFDNFDQLNIKKFKRSMANSAALLSNSKSHFDYVRPGIMLYGVSPFSSINEQLKPVMQLSAPVLGVKVVKKGGSVGYSENWTAEKNTNIAIIGIGYGDGYPRHAKNGTPVLINDTLCTLVGRVSMDLICVNIGDLKVNIGDKAILWGDDKLRVESVAFYSDTIGYELLTSVSSRVKFVKSA
jgi:alanine racemase